MEEENMAWESVKRRMCKEERMLWRKNVQSGGEHEEEEGEGCRQGCGGERR